MWIEYDTLWAKYKQINHSFNIIVLKKKVMHIYICNDYIMWFCIIRSIAHSNWLILIIYFL